MSAAAFVGLLIVTLLCIALAQRMAIRRGRSAKLWMWLAASLGPLPIAILALLPANRDETRAAS